MIDISTAKTIFVIGFFALGLIWFDQDPEPMSRRIFKRHSLEQRVLFLIEILIIAQVLFGPFFTYYVLTSSMYVQLAGVLLYIAGVVIAIWARYVMGKNWAGAGEEPKHKKVKHELITHGPFSFTRHPVYVGIILLFAGVQLSLGSYLIWLLIPIVAYFDWVMNKEERFLEKKFGTQYTAYKKRVRRYL
jgi:protein-S-isoprenylcysteine O-methyltransferase Ste14